MKVVINRTYKAQLVSTENTEVNSPLEYISFLKKFNVEIDMVDAIKDIIADEEVCLSLPVEMDYAVGV